MFLARHVPNLLSLSRIPLAGALILTYSSEDKAFYLASLFILLVALTTDILDGCLARKFNTASVDGYLLDGLGDRAIYVALILVFQASTDVLPILAWLLILREISMYAIRVSQVEWHLKLHRTRKLSLIHALFFRLWILTILYQHGSEMLGCGCNNNIVSLVATSMLAGAVLFGYLAIFRTFASTTKSPE